MTKVRLIAGCINHYEPEPGWRNVHLDKSNRGLHRIAKGDFVKPELNIDLADLGEQPAATYDAVRCHQVLEHLKRAHGEKAVQGFHHVLKPGGELDLEVPDIERVCKAWGKGEFEDKVLLAIMYGDDIDMQDDHLNAHRYGYSEASLTDLLHWAGFDEIRRIDGHNLLLRMVAVRS